MITRSCLAGENNAMAQTGVTLFYTINPFGPRAEGVFRVILFVCLFVMSSVVLLEDEGLIVFLNDLMIRYVFVCLFVIFISLRSKGTGKFAFSSVERKHSTDSHKTKKNNQDKNK